jgi:hypothetical protein
VGLPRLAVGAEPVRVVVVRREKPRAILADGTPVPITGPRCAIDLDGERQEATVFREYVVLQADTLEPALLTFSRGPEERLARMLNVLLEMPFTVKRTVVVLPYFARVFAVSAGLLAQEGWASEELYQLAEATYEDLKGRRLVTDGEA